MMDPIRLLSRLVENTLLDEAIRLSQDSIDDQVDSILLRFESDCIVDFGPELEEALLREAPPDDDAKDDEDPEDVPADNSDAAGATADEKEQDRKDDVTSQTADQDDVQPDEESDPLKPRIDLHKFAGKVSRLATNYDALLDMPIAIVNRARNYLEQNYDVTLADEFMEIIEHDFDIDVEREDHSEPEERPMATGAAASGLGGG